MRDQRGVPGGEVIMNQQIPSQVEGSENLLDSDQFAWSNSLMANW